MIHSRPPFARLFRYKAQKEILASPVGNTELDNSLTAAGSTPVRPRPISLPIHLTPVGNWNSAIDRSRLSGTGGSPTEFLRDYLSGVRGQEEEGDDDDEEEEEEEVQ